ncbi:MAG: hypothetical protein K0S65_6552 [Labilithrix sp.]|nr:hypothetical protein [Labilithrix sp.]
MTSPWGLLPIAIALGVVIVARIAAIAFDQRPLREKLLGGSVLTIAIVVAVVRVLGALGGLTRAALLASLVALAAGSVLVHRERTLRMRAAGSITVETGALAVVTAGAIFACFASAYYLPIWQWDALGYHLPYVAFALQSGSLAGVPHDIPYVSTYPHVVELFFVAWRAMLPDDRLVDAAQIPLGLLGIVATASLARHFGADHAIAAGFAWVTLPSVFLQLPTNYVDVASASLLLTAAYFVLEPPTRRNILVAGVALGLFLGSKPNAPVGTALLFAALAIRAWRAGMRAPLALATLAILVFGTESYVVNVVRHHNPIWPVEVSLGPIQLPGLKPMSYLLESGAAAPRLRGHWGPFRVFAAWASLDAPPAFDMRYGGLGLVFLAALPFAIFATWKRRSLALAAVIAASLASPDPAVPRYIFALPGIVLALAASVLSTATQRVRTFVLAGVAAAAVAGLLGAYPGLSGEGPPLHAYLKLPVSERERAVGADGPPDAYLDAHAQVLPCEWVAFDSSIDLPYLAWPPDHSHRALFIADPGDDETIQRIIADPRVRLLIVGDLTKAAYLVQSTFRAAFHCRSGPCTVYFRR